ncbi:MAG: ABC transporter permease [bacterium]|nr:ABC transporter permease [bacterium]
MIGHYLRVAFRQIARQRAFAGINMLGLSLVFACAIMVFAVIRHEYSYDRFHAKSERIARIIETQQYPSGDIRVAVTPFPLAPALVRDFPEIESTLRLYYGDYLNLGYGQNRFSEGPIYAESTFFDFFSYPLAQGDPATALKQKNTAVLSSETATKLFGAENPVGKTVRVDNKYDLTVTGVLARQSPASHLQVRLLVSLQTISDTWTEADREEWWRNSFSTYVLMRPNIDRSVLASRIDSILYKYRGEENSTRLFLQSLTDIHLTSDLVADNSVTTDTRRLFIYGLAALLVVIIACLNFVNLATVQTFLRSKEVGLRSCLGASLTQLRIQLLGETALTVGCAALLAIVWVELAFPFLRQALGTTLTRADLLSLPSGLGLIVSWLLVSTLVGGYLALAVVRSRPIASIRENRLRGGRIRAALVVLQFSISIVMILITLVILRQQQFTMTKSLGGHDEQILLIPLRGSETRDHAETLRKEIERLPGVLSATGYQQTPNNIQASSTYGWEDQPPDMEILFDENVIDHQFVRTFGINISSGRDLREGETGVCLINETAVRKIGWTDPIGKTIDLGVEKVSVVGVVQDFPHASLRTEIGPLVLYPRADRQQQLAVRIKPDVIKQTTPAIDDICRKVVPSGEFNPIFFDDTYDRLYRDEVQMQRTVSLFASLAIVLACLGLYGLAAFSIQRRTKEVGVRKVFGASIADILTLHAREYAVWLAIANLVAWPIGYLLSQQWLERFVYRTSVPWWSFVTVTLISLVLVAATVAFQTIRAAMTNPVQSLRYE